MRGLYYNTQIDSLSHVYEQFKKYNAHFKFPNWVGDGELIYSKDEWENVPAYIIENKLLVLVSGWFIYKNKKNNLIEFVNDYLDKSEKVFSGIEAGSFIIFIWKEGTVTVVADHFGTHPHFYSDSENLLRIAPTVSPLADSKHLNVFFESVFETNNHLFGNYTTYTNVLRFDPGHYYKNNKFIRYYNPGETGLFGVKKIPEYIRKYSMYWDKKFRILPLSSGLDSRLILASTEFEAGYTYGPVNSTDIKVGLHFSPLFNEYYHFRYLDPPFLEKEKEMTESIFKGRLKNVKKLLSIYSYVRSLSKEAYVQFDGYMGDVMQKGTFLQFSGFLGEFFRIFPLFYRYKISAKFILKKRYKKLDKNQFDFMYEDFLERTKDLNLDDYQKLTFYESVYGRCGRYAINGGNIMAGQMFTVVCPFALKEIFDCLIKQDFSEIVQFKLLSKIWKNISPSFIKIRTETGIRPNTPTFIMPFLNFLFRFILHYVPGKGNYGKELKRLN